MLLVNNIATCRSDWFLQRCGRGLKEESLKEGERQKALEPKKATKKANHPINLKRQPSGKTKKKSQMST